MKLLKKYSSVEYIMKLGLGQLIATKLNGEAGMNVLYYRGKSLQKVLRMPLSKIDVSDLKKAADIIREDTLLLWQIAKKENAIHNSKVSYATLSFHTKGMAVDIYCDGMTVDELADKAVDIGFRGVERNYDMDYVHVDVRPEQYYFVHFNGADYECDGRGNII